MTQLRLDEPTDEETFEEGLAEYLRAARRNEVSVERAWDCRGSAEERWEVEVVPVTTERQSN